MPMSINQGISQYVRRKRISFAMPGHKGKNSTGIRDFFALDVTELDDTDNLLNPTSYIKESQSKLAQIYGASSSYYLLGGSTCGIYTMISLAVSEGDKIIVDRFCHKSVICAIILCGARPVYVMPGYNYRFGFTGGMGRADIELAIMQNPDAKAVIITSPTYYGTVSDIKSISETVHDAGMLMLVDEAHGAHFHLSSFLPDSAVRSGADMVVQSVHKTLGSLSGGALLHINTPIDEATVLNTLSMYQTSSPSYACLCALEAAVYDGLRLGDNYKKIIDEVDKQRKILNKQGKVYWIGEEMVGNCNVAGIDKTRIVINFSSLPVTGFGAAKLLQSKYNIEVEMADENNIVCIVTPYNKISDIRTLARAVSDITKNMSTSLPRTATDDYPVPHVAMTPRQAHFSPTEAVDMIDSVGRVCGAAVCKYPPGIPLILPGEKIRAEHLRVITASADKGITITGISPGGKITVVK